MYRPNDSLQFRSTRALMRSILEDPYGRARSTQGLGMLRTYLDEGKVWRVNLWHSSCAVAGVSTIHDHPWDFESLIVSGLFKNTRYRDHPEAAARFRETHPPTHSRIRIRCGDDGGPVSESSGVMLTQGKMEIYLPGDVYSQKAEEIHESKFEDGTITINERKRREDGDHANIYFPWGMEFVDAEPRMAWREEITLCVGDALRRFDDWQR